jgi:hypothetical protein
VAASTSEPSANFYQTTRRYNPEDSHSHTRRRENLKSHLSAYVCGVSLSGTAATIDPVVKTI